MNDQQENLVSILVPCAGALDHTRLCLPRLLRHSRAPFELLCLDLASRDGSADYLQGLADAASAPVQIVHQGPESSFADAVNLGLSRAQGNLIAWVSNDVLVPALWLTQLVAVLRSDGRIGMVGPMSNHAPPAQRLADVPFRLSRARPTQPSNPVNTAPFDDFAEQHRHANAGRCTRVEQLGGFCFLVKREVLTKAPLLDPSDPEAGLDARRFCDNVSRAGYGLALCMDLFVHHAAVHVVA